ncbi:Nucleoid-associated protein ndpA [Paraburkholderia caribensis MBA4]|uniref:Nucleoid-associated protein ndpA n=1 Tax=Paraburkholderia caribensis MBA4 TaxID=1323664 RepID=A0A0P0RGQ4_9BURK|nr:nucleoid-associated protein [Paraburkholderia caribensis]ALL67854.1 Nucleoid-associated protein ndpA [Paraburkholderia caribensis MBA4]
MPQEIKNLIIHRFDKAPHAAGTVLPRANVIAVTPVVQALVDRVHELYAHRTSKRHGKFEVDENNYPMARYMRTWYIDKTVEFVQMSVEMMTTLKDRADRTQFARGGYVLIAHLSNGAREFLLVVQLNDRAGSAIDDALNVVESIYLDVDDLRVAGRVDLTGWQVGDMDRYVGFLKGKGDVSEYFRQFLGCNTITDPAGDTRTLFRAIRKFAAEQAMEPEQKANFIDEATNICAELADRNEELNLDVFANRLFPQEPDLLKATFARDEYKLPDGLVPSKKEVAKQRSFRGRASNWTVEIQRTAIRTQEVQIDEQNRRITLNEVPEPLLRKLVAWKADEPEQV